MLSCFKTGQFTDAAGNERKFIVCAAVREEQSELVLANLVPITVVGFTSIAAVPVQEFDGDGHIRSGIFLGVSVCSSTDEFNEEYGQKVALGRALNSKRPQKWLHTDFPELFSAEFVELVAARFAEMVAADPAKYAPGYYRNEVSDAFLGLSPMEQKMVMGIKNGSLDVGKLTNMAEKIKDITLPVSAE